MEKPNFKISISVFPALKKPYLLQVAMKNGDKYLCHEYSFLRRYDAVQLFFGYFNANEDGRVLEYHEKYLDEVDRVLRLPINEGRDELLTKADPHFIF